jgi:hypothetical protein
MLKVLILYIITAATSYNTNAFPIEYTLYNDRKEHLCTAPTCLGIKSIVALAKTNSYRTRDKLENLIRAKHLIKTKLASLVPYFNFSLAFSGYLIDPNAIPSLVGFLFPSNWFKWKESKIFYLAEHSSYLSLIANQIESSLELYYTLHKEIIETNIYKHYYEMMDNIIQVFKQQEAINHVSKYDISRIETIDSSAKIQSLILETEFKDTLPILTKILGLPIESDRTKFSIKTILLPHLNDSNKITRTFEQIYIEGTEKSYELKSINFLMIASKYAKKARMFEFFSPNSSVASSIGIGYFSNLKISDSSLRSLEIKRDETEAELQVLMHAQVLNINAAVDTYKEAMRSREFISFQLKTLLDIYDNTKTLDSNELSEIISSAINFDLIRNKAQHFYLVSITKLERLLLNSNYYSDLSDYVPKRIKPHKFKNWTIKQEDKKIQRALRRNEIEIAPEIYGVD